MALEPLTIITPENLKIILEQLFSNYTSKITDKFLVKTVELEDKKNITTDTTSLAIDIAEYNITNDVLQVYKNNVLMDKSEYTISELNSVKTITFTSTIVATVEAPINIKFTVIQSKLELKYNE